MYKCDSCGKITESKEKQNKVYVVKPKTYEHFRWIFDEKTKRKKKQYFETSGYEATGELNYCLDCYKKCEGVVENGNEKRIRRPNKVIKRRSKTFEKRSKNSRSEQQRVG